MKKNMTKNTFRAFLGVSALAMASASWGCVADRPSRNGVYNENQYVRKDFLVRPGSTDATGQGAADPGWMLKATVTQVSTPNPLGSSVFGIFSGSENGGSYVRFAVTQDKLQMVSMREFSTIPSAENTRVPEVVNAWPVDNVDLKYRVNLDGEKTNFFEENQELNWQDRQWVKVHFDKNDMSDIAPFGSYESDMLAMCTDVANWSTTLVPDSFQVDEPNNYLEWTVQITMPLKWGDATCQTAFGIMADSAARLGRQSVTMNLKYSLARANPAPTYIPLEVSEKDPIRHKYGTLDFITANRDATTGLVAARQLAIRFDPTKNITWYFAPGFPDEYKQFFLMTNGVKDQTNGLMKDAGALATLNFLNFDDDQVYGDGKADGKDGHPQPKTYGDVRYSFLRWMSDPDMQDGFAGVTQFVTDPRTGEALSSSISLNDFSIKDFYVQRIDAYLQSVGASNDINSATDWPAGPANCKVGDTMPIVPATVIANHNGTSSLYQKMQTYLQKPASTFGNLGPQDFTIKQDADFFRAYYAWMPYFVFADPDVNPFVIREGGKGVTGPGAVTAMLQKETNFQATAALIDRGEEPYIGATGPMGIKNATDFLNSFKDLTANHTNLDYITPFLHPKMHMDPPSAFSFEQIIARDARHCIAAADGSTHWESKDEWTHDLISTYWSQVAWHEFGHSLGLSHNFMASIDKNNFPVRKDANGQPIKDKNGNPVYGLFSNSVMEYNSAPDRVFSQAGWAPYDQGAISWIYANNAPAGAAGTNISGQASSTAPWKDPHGFQADGTTEIQYLYCSHQHLKYTPFCRQGDSGTTPSEIIANEIDAYEWQYNWRNFRTFRKVWDNSSYANAPAGLITDMRKFLSTWVFDWSSAELADTFRRIGITNPDPNGSNLEYYNGLTNKFNADASAANQLVAAFHKAVINESSGERPYKTIYDRYYGDVTQQGIILDKLFAMQGWVALQPTTNYDPNQAGSYLAAYSGIGDSSYQTVAEDAVDSMIGGQYDAYPYFVPLAVAQFAQDTHSPAFNGRIEVRDWIGGHVFYRLDDFLTYFRDISVQNGACTDIATCKYDPRPLSDRHNEFFGPDHRLWIWAYIPDRNTWVAVQKERNTASYLIVRSYNDDVVFQLDDGAFPGGAYGYLLPMKFFLDSFNMYN